ncbi:MAG TPA: aminoacyl-tRNA hydrolase [Acidimicrobiales bacterium]|nr:aminoacyl-tRNA hydrolase [Acidimicrobiales bacterium]
MFGRDRRGTPADLLVIGMGNPGAEYDGSRHNVGAETVALLAKRHGAALGKSREKALTCEVRIGDKRVALAFPTTYYNEAGSAARLLVNRYGIEDASQVVVVHDELDLPVGRMKVKHGGGLAGNNGLRSIKAHLKTDEFVRIRIGVDKPVNVLRGADHVLRKPSKSDRAELDVVVEEAADAVELIATDGIERAMERYNRRGERD